MNRSEILKVLQQMTPNTLMETLGIEFIDADPNNGTLSAQMQVSPKLHQPAGLLHGGASAALAESIGSAGSAMFADPAENSILGIELSCNHLHAVKEGMVTGKGKILHRGRSTHLWEIRIENKEGKLISHCKLTNIIIPKKK